MKTKIWKAFLFVVLAIGLSGCLTVATKEYTIEFTGKNSGTMTIKYVNIVSQKDDGEDVSEKDFKELTEKYLSGTELETSFPNATNFRKRLFVENNQLCAEVKMDFTSLDAIKIYQYDKKSQYIMNLKGLLNTESFIESNGTYAGEDMQLVLWNKKLKVLTLKTRVTEIDENDVSLTKEYYRWKN